MDLPKEFLLGMRQILADEYPTFVSAMEETPPVSIRINPFKSKGIDQSCNPVTWCGEGYYLKERIPFTFDPFFHAGMYYVQESSSMFIGYLLKSLVKDPVCMLDLCAAPGGKSTLALSSLPEGSFLVCNEYVPARANILLENIIKWGYQGCAITNNTPEAYGKLRHRFDVILVDAPCSGEGMFRKDSEAIEGWSEKSVISCAERQRSILSDVWSALRPGGLLIYSTCTYNTVENEDVAEYVVDYLGAEPLPIPDLPSEWGIKFQLKGGIPFYRFMPHKSSGEGFSVTVLRKGEDNYIPFKSKPLKSSGTVFPVEVKRLIKHPKEYTFSMREDTVYALPSQHEEALRMLAGMNILHYGIAVASLKGKEWQPHQSLALSPEANSEAFGEIQLNLSEARMFLRRESLILNTIERGYKMATFSGVPLGWVKCVGARANNLYPHEWRIRSGHIPPDGNILNIVRG